MKSLFDAPMTQMPIFVLFVSAGVLFESAFSLSVLKPGPSDINIYIRFLLMLRTHSKLLRSSDAIVRKIKPKAVGFIIKDSF